MSNLAIVLVVFGLLIALTRAPLVIAPVRTRDFYMKLFDTDARMRGLGVLVCVCGAACIWAGADVPGTSATIVVGVGLFMLASGFIAMMLFPTWARQLAIKVWSAWSPGTLRSIAAFAVAFGLLIAWFGWSL